MKIILILTLILIISVCGAGLSLAQYGDQGSAVCEDANLRTFDGTVLSVDVVGSSLTVKGIQQRKFIISSGTKLTKNIFDIKLSDVNAGDYVTIGYCDNPDGSVKTLRVDVAYDRSKS